ncbi:MAG: hypothetical protein AAF413_02545 [Patescibacteria group bacterium]
MSWLEKIKQEQSISPKLSLFIVILVVSAITATTLISFWNSETRELVNVLQQTGRSTVVDASEVTGITDDNTLESAELKFIVDEASELRQGLMPDVDFGGSELDGNPLGL